MPEVTRSRLRFGRAAGPALLPLGRTAVQLSARAGHTYRAARPPTSVS